MSCLRGSRGPRVARPRLDERAHRVHVTLTDGVRAPTCARGLNAAEDHRLRVHSRRGSRLGLEGRPALRHRAARDQAAGVGSGDVDGTTDGTYRRRRSSASTWLVRAHHREPRAAEYELLDDASGATIALTLLRCVGWLSRDDISSRRGGAGPQLRTPGAQLHGRNVLDYSVIPHAATGASARTCLPCSSCGRCARAGTATAWHLEPRGQLLNVESPAFPVSAIKRAEDGDGVIVRVYNTFDTEAGTAST